ncbi:MAG: HpaII family restriction endonuclease [Flavobacterium sp.]|uniref:HpaII family restriction endonuclease n=1 Tax=Flavobacterium sp. TaxID=239 RepID=UPI002FCAD1E9
MLKGNRGDWSEPYALFKLISDGKLYIGGENFQKIDDTFYPILKVIRNEKDRDISFIKKDDTVYISDGKLELTIPFTEFQKHTIICLNKIKDSIKKSTKGPFEIPEIENFLNSFSLKTLKAKAKLKNDITVQIEDPKTYISPTLGFSVKSQLGSPSTLVNASDPTNFTYTITGQRLTLSQITLINEERIFSKKIKLMNQFGAQLKFERVEHPIFASNLQTIDYNFDKILAEVVLLFYENETRGANTVANFIQKVTEKNSIGYNLEVNGNIYQMIMRKFLTDYALGMRAAEVWKREYQATGGYLIVRNDGELLCYHFYFTKNFEDYLYNNTKLDTPDDRLEYGKIYIENNIQKIKLNLQIRFRK